MKYKEPHQNLRVSQQAVHRLEERGSATVIIILILLLVSGFVALALSRNVTEAMIVNNDQSSTASFYAAQAGLETMTRNFNKVFDTKFNPTSGDIVRIQDQQHWPQGFNDFTFNQTITAPTDRTSVAILPSGPFEGMTALQDRWKLASTATNSNGSGEVQITRDFLNNRIPIFQFVAFYDDDFECHPGPFFKIDGRVHTNGNLYIEGGGGGSHYNGRVTASGEVVTGVARNGWGVFINNPGWISGQVFIANGRGGEERLFGDNNGSTPGGSVLNGPDLTGTNPDVADGTRNPQWSTCNVPNQSCKPDNDVYNGNLMAHVKQLKLPLKKDSPLADNIELIKRGNATDTSFPVLAASRYFNKEGVRVSLSDTQAQLPGGAGGVRLDGNSNGLGSDSGNGLILDSTRGYQPLAMIGGTYKASRLNGNRLYTGASYNGANRQSWIKVEKVSIDPTTSVQTTADITTDFLSLGITEKGPCVAGQLEILDSGYCGSDGADSRSIIKLQRYAIPGATLKTNGTSSVGNLPLHQFVLAKSGLPSQNVVTNDSYLLPNESTIASMASTDSFRSLRIGTASSAGYSTTDISSLTWASSYNGNGPVNKDKSTEGTSFNLIGLLPNTKGLGAHANSEIVYNLSGQYTTFQAKIGVDREINKSPCIENNWGSVQFQVLVDGNSIYQSPVMRVNTPYTQLNLPVSGANQLTLRVTDGGDNGNCDHADWADAKLVKSNASLTASSTPLKVVPVPIEFFDTREGLYSEDVNTDATYPGKVPVMGAMSMIDIDVANFRRFVRGEFNGQFPNGLQSTSIQTNNDGWIIYVSDRRGDRDNDGELDMENIYVDLNDPNGNNRGNTEPQFGENANHNSISGLPFANNNIPLLDNKIETDYAWEAARYREGIDYNSINWISGTDPTDVVNPSANKYLATLPTDVAALFDHKNYRRGVRLINGVTLPSVNVNGAEVGGFTLATENGAYIQGNYNTTGTGGNHSSTPANFTGTSFPSSVASDAITLLSNNWQDGNGFNDPFKRTSVKDASYETSYRTALLIGDTMSSLWIGHVDGDYTQGSAHYRLNGALHEGIVRTQENWSGRWMNYCGAYINLFNSHNNTGSWKLGGPQHVFGPQEQNRTFDSVFLNPKTIPPGTPFFQYVQVTAFRRNNE